MDAEGWNRGVTTELVWTAEPNRFLVHEVEALAGRRARLGWLI